MGFADGDTDIVRVEDAPEIEFVKSVLDKLTAIGDCDQKVYQRVLLYKLLYGSQMKFQIEIPVDGQFVRYCPVGLILFLESEICHTNYTVAGDYDKIYKYPLI